ncbi:MAG TPA: hypothetical protein VGS96_20110 [Thermoanaerobaculia bacterium]|jgi:hypothetical protein|nr:hypothetical protein [Thermoanaerobaculia bacterium]
MPSLEELLVQTKLISPPQLAVAERDAEMRKKRLAPTLIDLGFVSDRRFAEWVAEVTKLPIVDPITEDTVSDIEKHIPNELAREYEVLPIDVEADELTVAMINPLDRECIDRLQSTIGMKIRPVVGVYRNVRELVTRFYPEPKPAFDPSATIAVEKAPFEYGDDTMLRMHSREFVYERGDESLGSETRVIPPSAAPAAAAIGGATQPESQLDRIERHLLDLVRRVDAIDATLARILSRK